MSQSDGIRFCYDRYNSITNVQRYWLDSDPIEQILASSIKIYKYVLDNTAQKLKMNYETVKNTPKACMNPVQIKANLWLLFLTICEIFSLKLNTSSPKGNDRSPESQFYVFLL